MKKLKIAIPQEAKQEKLQLKTDKVKKSLLSIRTGNITKLNKLIYARVKLVFDKIDVPQKRPNRNRKPGWEIRQNG